MTGTTELSAEQVKALAVIIEEHRQDFSRVIRFVITPRLTSYGEAVTVTTISHNGECVMEGKRVVYRDGEVVTVAVADRRAEVETHPVFASLSPDTKRVIADLADQES